MIAINYGRPPYLELGDHQFVRDTLLGRRYLHFASLKLVGAGPI